MYTILSFFAAIAPGGVIVYWFYRQDQDHPEPKRLLLRVFVLGILSTIPLLCLDYLVTNSMWYLGMPEMLRFIFVSYVMAGFFEEWFKLIIVKKAVYDHDRFDEIMDGIIYTVTASMGFACMENVIYVTGHSWQTAVARGLTAVPLHAFCSGVMGYYLGRAKCASSAKAETFLIRQGFLTAVTVHGTYNFLLFVSPVFGVLYSAVIVLFIYFIYRNLRDMIHRAIEKDRRVKKLKAG